MLAVATVADPWNLCRTVRVAKNALVAELAVAAVTDPWSLCRTIGVAKNALVAQQSLARQTGLTADRLDDSTRSDQQQHRTHHTTNAPDL